MSKYDIRPDFESQKTKSEKRKAKNEYRIMKREKKKRKTNDKKIKTNQLHPAQDYCSVYEKCRYGKCSKSSNTNL